MKNIVLGIMTIGMIVFWIGCDKEEPNPGGTTSVTVSGTVLNKNGAALNGVILSLGTASATTDVSGAFSITGNVSGERGMLTATLTGYMKGSYSFVVEANKSYTTKMILGQADANSTVDVSSGGTVTLTSGAQVVLPANAVTLMDGSPYTGTNVKVEVWEINEDLGIAFSAMIPGNTLSALNSNNEAQELVSYGMMTVELYGDNNEALQLADGQTASLTFAIPAGQQATAPTTIGLWYFDETAGLWKEEGTAIRQGNQYIGTVSHFSTWNCDDPHPPCTISGCVEDSLGNAQPNLTLQVGQIAVQTDVNGCFSASVPAQFLPINIFYLDYVQMKSCMLYSLSSVVSPASNYNIGTVTLCSVIVTNPGAGVTFDGYTYPSIVLGNGQEWMAENLRTTTYANGDPIPNVTDTMQWIGLTTGAWAHYNNDSQYENPYGKLYNWYTVDDPRNVCPTGWHVPTDAEYTLLTDYLGGQTVAGGKMKSTGTQYWLSPNTDATNESGFSGLPGGYRGNNGWFYNIVGLGGRWWSSSEKFTGAPWMRSLDYHSGDVYRYSYVRQNGFSVRCLRD